MSNKKSLLKGILIGITAGLAIVALVSGAKFYLHGKLPGSTVIAGTNLSYITPEQATKILKEKADEFMDSSMTFLIQGQSIKVKPKDLGITVFPEETIKTIERINLKNQKNPFQIDTLFQKENKDVIFAIDEEKTLRLLDEKLGLDETKPQNAHLQFNDKNQLEITEDKPGKAPDYDAILTGLKSSAAQLSPRDFKIALNEANPTVTKEELEKEKDAILKKLETPISINYEEDFVTKFTPKDNLDMIEFTSFVGIEVPHLNMQIELPIKDLPAGIVAEAKSIKILIKRAPLNEFTEASLREEIEVEVNPVSIYMDEEEEEVVVDGYGKDGIRIEKELLAKTIELAINEQVQSIEVPVQKLKAPVTISKELQEIGIKELLGTGHTTFYGSTNNRIHNVNTGLDRFSGVLIKPDEEFSFNETLGRVDNTTGYRKELVITAKGTIPEYGGGLCQVSTTAYRAAMFTGLPITSRRPHSYAVSYYSQLLGYGLDATIYLGGQDLKFTNDTGQHILIHSYSEGKHAYFKFYGTSDGRSVELDGPYLSNYKYPLSEPIFQGSADIAPGDAKQMEKKHTGFEALWNRTIFRPDQEPLVEEIFSHYNAVREKYLVPVGDPRVN